MWLAEVIARLEGQRELLRRLLVMADPTCVVRGERLVVPCQPQPHDGRRGPGELSVRYTPAVRTVVSAASGPIAVNDLLKKLTTDYPDMPPAASETLLAELVARRVLLTSLHPPMTAVDALAHVIDELAAVGADEIPAVVPTMYELSEIRAELAGSTSATDGERKTRGSATHRIRVQSGVEQLVAVDLRLDCSLIVPRRVAHEAEKAADLLARLAPSPTGSPAWEDYHARFLDRYGPNALVRVVELVEPDLGLDYPAGYRGSLLRRPRPALTDRDERLLDLAQCAACENAHEIVLTDALMAGLAQDGDPWVPHVDLCFHLQASTPGELERGEFTLVVAGLAPAAGATAGRFLPLLAAADRERMSAAYASLPTADSNALRAQVSSPPLHVRTENVNRVPALFPHVISLGEHRREPTLPLNELAVGADQSGFYLVFLPTEQRVEPTATSAVSLANFTHPLARLLYELPRARAATIGPFSWGAARTLPFLPRVRHGRIVLAPATWKIKTTDLATGDAALQRWMDSLTAWRERLGVPTAVEVGDDDRRLRLELDQSADALLLRTELDHRDHITVREAPEASGYGWFGGRAHEITLALASTRTGPQRAERTAPLVVVGPDHGRLPGEAAPAFVRLYGHPDRHEEILTVHLPALMARFDRPPVWWFVRHDEQRPHLGLCFRVSGRDTFGQLATRLGAWAAGLRRAGLLSRIQWDTYYPETGRYGAGAAMDAAEAVFAEDSLAAIAQLALPAGSRPHPLAVTAASLLDLAISFTGEVESGMRWLIDNFTAVSAQHPHRPLYREAMRLANPRNDFAALREHPGGDRVTTAWAARREALNSYHAALTAQSQIQPSTVLPSLMRAHYLRSAGRDEHNEQMCYRLVRSAALAWAAARERRVTP